MTPTQGAFVKFETQVVACTGGALKLCAQDPEVVARAVSALNHQKPCFNSIMAVA